MLNAATYGQTLSQHEVLFIIHKMPANTPRDASIFMASDIDGWYPDVENRKFHKDENGQLTLRISLTADTLTYKLTRGSWDAVEARKNGRARPNRVWIAASGETTIELTIDAWEDISYGSYTVYMFLLLLAALQGVLLMVAINTIRNKNKRANSILSVLLLLITISLLGRASTFDPNVFNWQPKLLLIPELILFTYGPIFLFYIHKLLVIRLQWHKVWPHFLPALIQIAVYIPYVLLDNQTFIYRVLDKELFPYFAATGILALIFNGVYWLLCWRLIHYYTRHEATSEKQKNYVVFLKSVLLIKAGYLVIWIAIVLIFISGKIMGQDYLYLSEHLIDLLWLLFSLIIFALAYYAVKNPELLRERKRYQEQQIQNDEVQQVMQKLNSLLNDKKIYLKQDLTLERLANEAHTSPHTLSRVINEQYAQNFTDLINAYRINEFIERAKLNPEISFLGLAFDVGFNSKPTFNRAFKKAKGMTPREFMKMQP